MFAAWIDSKQIRHSDITAVDKLAFIGKRGMGALEFEPALYEGTSPENTIVLQEISDAVSAFESLASELKLETPVINMISSHIRSHSIL